ncbi:Galactose/methyl galactoside import ATP-binding protein MglA [Anaerobiospirillum thomasii]|uniref:Galactose/methyl galactoside import ATP-binding protein MglA n=1 Tax=Anaerobiospirillum thomasii TaxID=179995 RepID=A0A2X0WLC3_9GAMM|nr:sugar ABC transporter ATP-binding protein [Anaerobiospirillum thomasii]SPT68989.1 Galactose/methyl galactoside import ATP-binding protein MglA [Anaerobiospirillum thomasii]SPT71227.1 Galactose/methyl galactoside import ATP-binding protein MglA [Anaerobiospirillum thomasii]
MSTKDEIYLHAEKIDKIYPGTKALDQVSFDIKRGKVNVLIGENGAGKSTLMRIIAGIEKQSAGKLFLQGREVEFNSTVDARKEGIAIIHQELCLFPNMTVFQNLFMASERTKNGILDDAEHRKLARQVLERLNYPIDPDTLVGDLRVGQQQMIEIARNLLIPNLKILIMDEPTSSLSEQEVEVLFNIMRELTATGISIVYISHRLEELMRIGDFVTIFRDGKLVAEAAVKDIDVPWIVKQMVGEGKSYPKREQKVDWSTVPKVLEIKDLTLPKNGGGYLLKDVSFSLHKGEVLGIYGLLGAGRTEIFECIMGMRPSHTGDVILHGEKIQVGSVPEQIAKGFAWLPEDRQRDGLVQTLSIDKNIALSNVGKYTNSMGLIDKNKESDAVTDMIKEVHIKVADKELPILSLSGGNQQKVVFAKGALTGPEIMLLDEPSRGIDIGAKTEIFKLIYQYAQKGVSLLVVSSELEEIIAIADRIIVLSNGIKTAEFEGDEITQDNLVKASYLGHHKAD